MFFADMKKDGKTRKRLGLKIIPKVEESIIVLIEVGSCLQAQVNKKQKP